MEPGGDAAEDLAGARLASALRDQRAAGTPADMAVVHEPAAARGTDGEVPLVLWPGTCTTRTWRSCGTAPGCGSRAPRAAAGCARSRAKYPDPIEASVLYFDRDTRRLQAWDEIKLGGLGLTSAEVSRHLPKENQPGASASPSPSGSRPATGSPTPSPGPTGTAR